MVSIDSKNIYRVAKISKLQVGAGLTSINRLVAVAEARMRYQVEPVPPGCPQLPAGLQLRSYQQQAITNWFKNQGRGTLKMATGSGKTITALAIAHQLHQQIGLQVLIIICPFRHLVNQWGRECEKFHLQPILACESIHKWQSNFSYQLARIHTGQQQFLTIVTTNETLITAGFQSQLKYLPDRTLIIGDEVHNLGAKKRESSLPRNVGLRLALSATPERHYDEIGTQNILDYFGDILQPEFTLKDAIDCGALVHYLYYPILVELTPAESDRYLQLTRAISRKLLYNGQDRDRFDTPDLTPLLMQRARLVGAAANKLTALRTLMQDRLDTSHTLFYCGDGSSDSTRQLTAVTHLLGTELGYRVNTYTASTSLPDREQLRQQFESGVLQGLVAIRCLDEGIDIPAIKQAVILASSTNPRQFIQRRGRILRPDLGKDRAILYDMVVLPPELVGGASRNENRQTLAMERNLLKKELLRLIEFADLADNAAEARTQLLALQKRYGLLEI
ncbi:DNA phosphorothioation system restriction enzyme [Chamaesiphon sp. VAR_69_metabat_338]|uniref:DNA phosphorothioation system restriction enzyme n=1 Tax=Chamaesiphon sp. VAR_69_metabat_338 TaxID=2964704 RepID=UPI00286E9FAF|nr:DNA phosphorothioation system restriction enzyme [Chamaesiphon sp. VAR_69_metabat_338]